MELCHQTPPHRTAGRVRFDIFINLQRLSLAAAITVGRRTMRMSSAMAAAADPNVFAQLAPGSKTQAVVENLIARSEG